MLMIVCKQMMIAKNLAHKIYFCLQNSKQAAAVAIGANSADMLLLYICLISMPGALMQPGRRNGFEFHQDDYKLDFERVELAGYNSNFMEMIEITTFKLNGINAINLTSEYKIDVGNALEIVIEAYKLIDNQYRRFPVDYDLNFCDAVSKNYVGLSSIVGRGQCGNFTGCPILKGRRTSVCNFIPDETQFPPFMPDGFYMLDLQVRYKSAEMFVARGYARIYRLIIIPE